MNCAQKESLWKEHEVLLKKYRKGDASKEEVFESANRLHMYKRCSERERSAEKRCCQHAGSEKAVLDNVTVKPNLQTAKAVFVRPRPFKEAL